MGGKGNFKHGHAPKGKTASPTWMCWHNLKTRCQNPKIEKYQLYGARGITVCDRWNKDFRNFLEDMGVMPEGYTLDRIDPNQGYFKDNCRWACKARQAHNRRDCKLDWNKVAKVKHMHAEGFSYREIAGMFNISKRTVGRVLKETSWKAEMPIILRGEGN